MNLAVVLWSIGLISNNDKSSYREEVEEPGEIMVLSQQPDPQYRKTKELIIHLRRSSQGKDYVLNVFQVSPETSTPQQRLYWKKNMDSLNTLIDDIILY